MAGLRSAEGMPLTPNGDRYNSGLVSLSIAIAALGSYSALSVAGRIKAAGSVTVQRIWLLADALTMGGGVWAMHFIALIHYIGMAGTYFFLGDAAAPSLSHNALEPLSLVFWVSFTSVLIASLAIFITFVDSRIQQATHEESLSRYRMRDAIESIPDGFSLYDMEDRLVDAIYAIGRS